MLAGGCRCGALPCRCGRRYRGFGGFGDLDVQATVVQMDRVVAQLRQAWNAIDSKWTLQWTSQLADSEDARLASLKRLIDDLDVGGVGREHVFFPLEGQTQAEAWATWQETANYARDGLNELGAMINKWSFTNVAADVGQKVKDNLLSTGTVLAILAGGFLLLNVFGGRRRAFAGYGRRKRRRRR